MNITLNLVVLRSPDITRAAAFYSRLGLHFSKQRHGAGPEHYAAELPGAVCSSFIQSPTEHPHWALALAFESHRLMRQ